MSKRNKNNYAYQNNSRNILTAVIAVFIALILFAGGILAGYFIWGKKDENPVAALPEGGMYVVPEDQEENGIRLMSALIDPMDYDEYGIAPTAESAQTVKATVKDAQGSPVTGIKLNWTAEWAETSGWASGKQVSDYVTISPSADTLTLTVTCNEAFGALVNVKAAIQGDAGINATVKLHYRQRATAFSATITYGTASPTLTFKQGDSAKTVAFPGGEFGSNGSVNITVTGSEVYTDAMEVSGVSLKVTAASAYKTAVTNAGGTAVTDGTVLASKTGSSSVTLAKLMGINTYSGISATTLKRLLSAGSGYHLTYTLEATVNGEALSLASAKTTNLTFNGFGNVGSSIDVDHTDLYF